MNEVWQECGIGRGSVGEELSGVSRVRDKEGFVSV